MSERIKPKSQTNVPTDEFNRIAVDKFISELEEGLRIDKNALDEALERAPDLYYRVSKELTLATSRRDAIKQELAEIEAEADNTIRIRAEGAKVKLTETDAKMQARLEPAVKRANRDLIEANRVVGMFSALKDAFNQRSYAIKDLVSLYVANYYSDSTGRQSSGNVKDHDAQVARRGMAQQRREQGYGGRRDQRDRDRD